MPDQPKTITIDDWILRIRTPDSPGPHPVLVMLHGWTGDEKVMWIFADRFPNDYLIVAPRGLFNTPLGGYAWHPTKAHPWPSVGDFQTSVHSLHKLLNSTNFPAGLLSTVSFAGFSQGAALAYTYALLYSDKVDRIMGLAGFLPEGVEYLVDKRPLIDKNIFIAHGSKDELVPVWRARQAVQLLSKAGARVTYCEDDVGHKLSAGCFRGLESFFQYKSSK